MLYKKIPLDNKNNEVYLEIFVADKIDGFTRDALLVIPGGGYSMVCSDREGEPIALEFMSHGFNTFVLHYSVESDKVFPTQLIEASKAIKHIKDHAEEYGINPDRVFSCGFSAGGHLCGALGTMWHKKEIYEAIDMPFGYNKPAGVMLIYPVISPKYHDFSFRNLMNDQTSPIEDFNLLGIENNVDERSCPTFIMHTSNDEIVNIKNSLCLANAFADKNLKFELHIYPDAPHGVALANKITKTGCEKYDNPSIAKWVENAVFWANNI